MSCSEEWQAAKATRRERRARDPRVQARRVAHEQRAARDTAMRASEDAA